ncbi:hypothetical protein BKA67DRAFT_219306 [Truncatella angustata]|uniref:Infection structure specific protein n=1 Tax=Truncatella angustata TaxID=152316 RepID=A0A9P9A1U0_9PEZI|nr:uncharacterized protein BKA67DRAFT_219306 [Truncatella angustata]KAH6658683.1 hypothetical protein BKA67DRAFT_219306 [Truncatella angustata]KAH8202528.1 hypothetical protein TruAng_003336 [Truncatella angustata]
MRFTTVFVTASSLLGASALPGNDVPTPVARGIEARDTAACTSAASKYLPSITDSVPTPSGEVLTYLATATLTDECAFPTVTGTLGSSLSNYASSYSSWQSQHLPEVRSVYQACSDVPEVTSELNSYFAGATGSACSSILAQITSASSSKNAGPRETGMPFAAAALAAGVAVAML